MTQHNIDKARNISEILSHAHLHSSDPSKKFEVLTYRSFSCVRPDVWEASLVATTNKGLVKLLTEDTHFEELRALGDSLAEIQVDTRVVLHEVSEGCTVRIDGKLRRRDGVSKVLGGMAVMLGLKKQRVLYRGNGIRHESFGGGELFQNYESRAAYPPDLGRSGPPPIPYHQRPSQIARFGWRSSSDRGDPSGLAPYMAMRYTTPVLASPYEDELALEIPRPAAAKPQTVMYSDNARACGTRAERNNRMHLHMAPGSIHPQTENRQVDDPAPTAASNPSPVAEDSQSFYGVAFLPHFDIGQSNTAQPPRSNAQQPTTPLHQIPPIASPSNRALLEKIVVMQS